MSEIQPYPSYASCVAEVLSASQQPLSIDVLLSKVASQRPLGKGARSAIYRAIGKLFQAVPVSPGQYGWLSHLLSKSTVRHTLTSEEVRRGYIMLDELEHVLFFPQFFQSYRPDGRSVTIEMFGGPTIRAQATIERKTWSLRLGQEFVRWLDESGAQGRDDLLISVVNGAEGIYTARLQLREMRDENAIQHRNIQLALLAEEIAVEDRQSRPAIPPPDLIARLIGRGFFRDSTPIDDLHYVLQEYSNLTFREGVGFYLDPETNRGRAEEASSRPAASPSSRPGFGRSEFGWDTIRWGDQGPVNGARRGLRDQDTFDEDEFAGYEDDAGYEEEDWDEPREVGLEGNGVIEDSCESYDGYLEQFESSKTRGAPLSHEDYHLLEAELESLVHIEQEFGHLLDEQMERKDELSDRLFIDPDTYFSGDWEDGADADNGGPPFWAN